MDIKGIKFDDQGLVPAVAQDADSKEVLMLAYMNIEALEKTLSSGRAHYFSRSRNRLWMKGETSGNFQFVKGIYYDCDEDAILLQVDQKGPACHTGERSCFFRKLDKGAGGSVSEGPPKGAGILADLYKTLIERKSASAESSYVASLYSEGLRKILEKVDEESSELVEAAAKGVKKEIVHEMADLWFHTMVLLASQGIDLKDVFDEFNKRFGVSGHEEKRKRKDE